MKNYVVQMKTHWINGRPYEIKARMKLMQTHAQTVTYQTQQYEDWEGS